MKNNAIVLNKLNRSSEIIKKNETSYVVNNVDRSLGALASKPSTLSIKSSELYSSMPENKIHSLESKNKVYKDTEIKVDFPVTIANGKIRYIRDWLCGSSASQWSHWVEIQVISNTDENLALNADMSAMNDTITNAQRIVDGSLTMESYAESKKSGENSFVEIDLGKEYDIKDIKHIKVWHYYDGRKYKNTKTEIAGNEKEWIVLRSSEVDGEYVETSEGITLTLDRLLTDTKFTERIKVNSYKEKSENPNLEKFIIHNNPSLVTAVDKTSNYILLPSISLDSIAIDEGIRASSIAISSKDKRNNNHNFLNNYRYASKVVAAKVPVSTGGSGGNGAEGLKSLKLELQCFNYVKVHLGFSTKKVVDAIGVPPGLKIIDGSLEGSPVIAGDYNTKILLDDNTFISAQISVSVLERKL